MKDCAVIIVAAGSSRRAGFDKLLAPLHGIKVLERSILAFLNSPRVSEIVVVCPEARFHALDPQILETDIAVTRVDGGEQRHLSVQNGLKALLYPVPLVAVHDGARPLIVPEQIERCIRAAEECGAAACAHPVTDTLKYANEEHFTEPVPVDRTSLWCMETPQVFDRALLTTAYQNVLQHGEVVTDEVSALQTLGHPTMLVHNHTPNPKITWPQDVALAELLLTHRHTS